MKKFRGMKAALAATLLLNTGMAPVLAYTGAEYQVGVSEVSEEIVNLATISMTETVDNEALRTVLASTGYFGDYTELTAHSHGEQQNFGSGQAPMNWRNQASGGGWVGYGDEGVALEQASAWQIRTTTLWFDNISFSADTAATNGVTTDWALAYSLDGINFTKVENTQRPSIGGGTGAGAGEPQFVNTMLPEETANQPVLYIRVFMINNTMPLTGRTNGNHSINNIRIDSGEISQPEDAETIALTSEMVAHNVLSNETFTGRPFTPSITVRHNGEYLVEDEDFTIRHIRTTAPGTATVRAIGTGDFTGYADVTFEIASVLPKTMGTMLTHLGSFDTGARNADGGVAEIVAFNPANESMYIVTGTHNATGFPENVLHKVPLGHLVAGETGQNFSEHSIISLEEIGAANDFPVGELTNVTINTRLEVLAVSVQHPDFDGNGFAVILDFDGNYIAHFEVGVQPDMLEFSPNGNYLMVANEGEPNAGFASDPAGSVTLINLTDVNNHQELANLPASNLYTIGFEAFDTPEARQQLIDNGVLLRAGSLPSLDLEPEYVAFTEDNATAFIALQEANAIAVFDMATRTFTGVYGLGFVDHSLPGNEIHLSTPQPSVSGGNVNNADYVQIDIRNHSNIFGIRMPDGLATINIGGYQYILTPNEGDARDDSIFTEIAGGTSNGFHMHNYSRVNTANRNWATHSAYWAANNPAWHTHLEQNMNNLEFIINSHHEVINERPGDMFILGGRSFSIFRADDLLNGPVFESGSDFEKILAQTQYNIFNTNHAASNYNGRTARKGPEPEDIKAMRIGDRYFAFIGLERAGGLMMYDITNPAEAFFVDYFNNRANVATGNMDMNADLGAEGVHVIPAEQSPTGWPMVLIANEVSGTVTVLQVNYGFVEDVIDGVTPEVEADEEIAEALANLETAINEAIALGLVEADFTATSWSAFSYALNTAQFVLENGYTLFIIEEAILNLQRAIDGLVYAYGEDEADFEGMTPELNPLPENNNNNQGGSNEQGNNNQGGNNEQGNNNNETPAATEPETERPTRPAQRPSTPNQPTRPNRPNNNLPATGAATSILAPLAGIGLIGLALAAKKFKK